MLLFEDIDDNLFYEVMGCDGNLKKVIPLKPDMSLQKVSINLTGANQLKVQVSASRGDKPFILGKNPMIKK